MQKDFLAMAGNNGKSFVLDLKAAEAVECLCEAVTKRLLDSCGGGGKESKRLLDEYDQKYKSFGYT